MTRIFILSNHLIFSRGLESLLRQETNYDIVGQETDEQKAIERIKKLRPDVIILDGDKSPQKSTQIEMQILREVPGSKVISLNLHNNAVYIHQVTQKMVKSVKDFIEAIEYNPFSTEGPDTSHQQEG